MVPGYRGAAARFGDALRLVETAVGHENSPWLELAQVPQRQLAHLARADYEHRLVVEMGEYLANVVHRHAGDRHVAPGDAGVAADPLGNVVGLLEKRVQDPPGRAALMSQFVSAFHLAGDLTFADDHAVEAGRDPK